MSGSQLLDLARACGMEFPERHQRGNVEDIGGDCAVAMVSPTTGRSTWVLTSNAPDGAAVFREVLQAHRIALPAAAEC